MREPDIEHEKKYALQRLGMLIDRLRTATNGFEIESNLYMIQRVAEDAFKITHNLNSRGRQDNLPRADIFNHLFPNGPKIV